MIPTPTSIYPRAVIMSQPYLLLDPEKKNRRGGQKVLVLLSPWPMVVSARRF
jgi:hypothetical protein